MSEGILNKDKIDEGIVVVAPTAQHDEFNIGSTNADVLRLQICASQFTKEQVVECLTIQQKNIIARDAEVSPSYALTGVAFGLGMIIALVILFCFRRSE